MDFSSLQRGNQTNRSIVKPRPNNCKISTQHIATLLGATCCVLLDCEVLRHVGFCLLKNLTIFKLEPTASNMPKWGGEMRATCLVSNNAAIVSSKKCGKQIKKVNRLTFFAAINLHSHRDVTSPSFRMKPNTSGKNRSVWTEEMLCNRRSVGVAEKRLQVECVSQSITKLDLSLN